MYARLASGKDSFGGSPFGVPPKLAEVMLRVGEDDLLISLYYKKPE
ncbi:hypothetical protein [Bradyrhizobium sp. DASA03007]